MDNKNPYFHELKGQILFESGKSNESVTSFRKAIKLKPDEKALICFWQNLYITLKETVPSQSQLIYYEIYKK